MNSIRGRLVTAYLAVVLVFMVVLGVILTLWLHSYYVDGIESLLQSRGQVAASFFDQYLANQGSLRTFAPALAQELQSQTGGSVQVVDRGGRVLASGGSAISGRVPLDAPLHTALGGQAAVAVVRLGRQHVVEVDIPLGVGDVVGAVRLTSGLSTVNRTISTVWHMALYGMLLAAALAAVVGLLMARSVTVPLSEVTSVAAEIARGRLERRIRKRRNDEIGQLAETMNHMADELVRLERVRNEFLGGVSHELKTPLTVIKGYAITLLDDPAMPPEQRDEVAVIEREAGRLERLVEDLLDLARGRSGRLHLRRGPVDLVSLIREAQQDLSPGFREKDQTVTYVGPERLMWAADGDRMRQVLLNVLDNARKWSPSGERVEVRLHASDSEIELSVRDRGPGVPQEDLAHIFERFYRGHGAWRPGSGLGLAVAREIVEAHGGRMEGRLAQPGLEIVMRLPLHA